MEGIAIKFTKPENWKVIKPEHYADFSIVNNQYTPCEFGFAVEGEKGRYDVVSLFNYGKTDGQFIANLKKQLDVFSQDNAAVSEINEYIKENAEGYAVTKTDYVKPLYYKKGKLFDKSCFINVMEIKTNVATSYSLQLFAEVGENLYCLTTSAAECDATKPFESLIKKYPHIAETVNVVFKSMETK